MAFRKMKEIWSGTKKIPDFTIDAQKELGYYIVSGKLLNKIILGKETIAEIRKDVRDKILWAILEANHPYQFRMLLVYLLGQIDELDGLVQANVLPYIQPSNHIKKYQAVRGYVKQYSVAVTETISLLSDLEQKHINEIRTLVYQRIMKTYGVFFTMVNFLNGISPDKDFVQPAKDKTYVLPSGFGMGMYGGRPPPEGKEDKAGQDFWEEYAKLMDARLRRLEEMDKRKVKVRGRP